MHYSEVAYQPTNTCVTLEKFYPSKHIQQLPQSRTDIIRTVKCGLPQCCSVRRR